MRLILACILAGLCTGAVVATQPAPAGAAHVSFGAVVRITSPDLGRHEFIWADVDPENGDNMIVCGARWPSASNRLEGYVYRSGDRGNTWREVVVDRSSTWVSEESCGFGPGSVAYFAASASNTYFGQGHHSEGRLNIYKSADGGSSWDKAYTGNFVDWTALSVDKTKTSHGGDVYLFGNDYAIRPGHWWHHQPILMISTDGARHFSRPLGPFHYVSGFARGGSTVLSDGTAIAAYDVTKRTARTPKSGEVSFNDELHFDLEAMTASSKSLFSRRSVIYDPSADNVIVISSGIVEDASRGPYHGRIYVTWVARDLRVATLFVASSDDRGYHWITHKILVGRSPALPSEYSKSRSGHSIDMPSIAVTEQGMVGVLWSEDRGRALRFAVSRDGGNSFVQENRPVTVPSRPSSLQYLKYYLDGQSEGYDMRAVIRSFSRTGKTPEKTLVPGLCVCLTTEQGALEAVLVADGRVFQAFWAQLGADGKALWSRTIHVDGVGGATRRTATPSDFPQIAPSRADLKSECVSATQPIRTNARTVGLHDVTQSIAVEVRGTFFDPITNRVGACIVLANKGGTTVVRPIKLSAIGLLTDFGETPVALDASGKGPNGQPVWDVSNAVPPGGLVHAQTSTPFLLSFRVPKLRLMPYGSLISMGLKIFSN